MGRRLKLHEELCKILGSRNVYWQPPESMTMNYPCIVYKENPSEIIKANNKIYMKNDSWNVTVIRSYQNRDKTKEIIDRLIESFDYCGQSSHFVYDNLIHDVFKVYY